MDWKEELKGRIVGAEIEDVVALELGNKVYSEKHCATAILCLEPQVLAHSRPFLAT